MSKNKLSDDQIAFLTPMEAKWSNTTLNNIKKELDDSKVKNIMFFSKENDEDMIAFSLK